MKEVLQLKRIENLLKRGKFSQLEEYLLRLSKEKPYFLQHLVWFYIETRKYEKALCYAKRLIVYEDKPFNRYAYYKILKLFCPEKLEEEKARLKQWFSNPLTRNYYLLYSGFINLMEEKDTLAFKRFTECTKSGLKLGEWGRAQILYKKGYKEKALNSLKKCEKQSKDFPLILLDMGRIHSELGNKYKAVFYLNRFNRIFPINTEGHYELGINLMECSLKFPLIGRILKNMAIRELMIKAFIEPPKAENLWIYRILSHYFAQKGNYNFSAKWILIEQQVLYQVINLIESKIKNKKEKEMEDLSDLTNTLRKLLIEKELFTEDEFAKVYSEIRETRILEEMLKLSENQDKKSNQQKIE